MKYLLFIAMGLFIAIETNAVEYYDLTILRRMGCSCTNNVQRDAFLTRINNKVARVLASDYNFQAGMIRANTSILRSVLGSSSGLDVSAWVTTTKNYERAVLLIDFGGF
ncbi:MAG: hypothetical protein QM504_03325 [Pseudomonadota bacterium]